MKTQRGIAIRYFAGEKIENAIEVIGTLGDQKFVGKAVKYGDDPETVELAGEDDYADFAGVIKTVSAEASVERTQSNVNAGGRTVEEGDAVGVLNDHVILVKAEGEINYKDLLTTAADGKMQSLALSATETAPEIMKICGRAMADAQSGEAFPALIWVRK